MPKPGTLLQELDLQQGSGWSACSARGSGRSRNSDAWAVDLNGACMVFVVADGVGTMKASPHASLAAARAASIWGRGRSGMKKEDVPSLIDYVNAEVKAALEKRGQPGATTVACAIVSEESVVLATVGDSEALAIDIAGPARRLNELDHVPARPNILLAWLDGESPVEPHAIELAEMPYRLCLVTDGVSGALDDSEIATLIRSCDPSEAARELVKRARRNGASDDVTALVISGDVADWHR